jgi:2-hydroxy-3-keto-5-methylthiopentenyl-1-phosphate phosphatase
VRPSVRSILIDFDGTACLHDVAEHLLDAFGVPGWRALDEAWERGEIATTQEVLKAEAEMLRATTDELLAFALTHCPVDPTLAPFLEWCRTQELDTAIVSDGFGLYIRPLLSAAGIDDVPVITNDWNDAGMAFPNGHGECIRCGTCKMRAVVDARGPVAFVGEGTSDRFAALYADVTFAKDALVAWCEGDGVPFVPWRDFDDIRSWLEGHRDLPGAVAPLRCPGWTIP